MMTSLHHEDDAGFPAALVREATRAALTAGDGAHAPVFAIAGLQGSGKSTLAAQIARDAERLGKRVAVLSLDDLYLGRAERARLAQQVHPLLATRGPPGTHDVALGCESIDALRAGRPLALPRFDKLSDDRRPRDQWTRIDAPVDLILIEGWCLSTPAEEDDALAHPINALERDEDADGIWRRFCNDALRRDYPPLWSRFDALWFLQPPDFDVVAGWRWQQEQTLAAADARAISMDAAGVARFVQFFERVSRQALRTLPAIADHVITLDAARRVVWSAPESR